MGQAPDEVKDAADEELARKLWQVSEELTGLHYPWPA